MLFNPPYHTPVCHADHNVYCSRQVLQILRQSHACSLSQSVMSGTHKQTPDVNLAMHFDLEFPSKLGPHSTRHETIGKPHFSLTEKLNVMFLAENFGNHKVVQCTDVYSFSNVLRAAVYDSCRPFINLGPLLPSSQAGDQLRGMSSSPKLYKKKR